VVTTPVLWRKNSQDKMNQEAPKKSGVAKIVKLFMAVVTFVIAAFFVLAFAWNHFTPRIVMEADAGFKNAKQTIDPEQLRAWALESIKHWHSTNGFQTIPESEVPEYIRNLYPDPPDAAVIGDGVLISWGGGFFHWAIFVGPTNSVRTKDESPGYQTVEWTQGIYYSREGYRKIQ